MAYLDAFIMRHLEFSFLTKRLLPTDIVLDVVATFYSDYFSISKKYKT